VPLPALGEVLVLLLLFEIIREAGVRVPSGIGSALTIGGTLVVGQAAVRAGIVSAPMIIITAAVVIAFFAIPSYDMVQFTRFVLYPLLLAAGFLGIFGILFVSLMMAFDLCSLRSFGRGLLEPLAPLRPNDFKDSVVRVPWWAMNTRPTFTGFTNPIRQGPQQKPHPPRRRRA
jgi:spore germination protein KA